MSRRSAAKDFVRQRLRGTLRAEASPRGAYVLAGGGHPPDPLSRPFGTYP